MKHARTGRGGGRLFRIDEKEYGGIKVSYPHEAVFEVVFEDGYTWHFLTIPYEIDGNRGYWIPSNIFPTLLYNIAHHGRIAQILVYRCNKQTYTCDEIVDRFISRLYKGR